MIRLGVAREMAAQFASTGHSAGWHIVLLEVAGNHLPHRRVIVHNEDMARFSGVIAHAVAASAGGRSIGGARLGLRTRRTALL